jgi:hypothetical protein
MVVAVVSLIVALGGTAVALPGSFLIGQDDLRDNSVGARALGKVFLGKLVGLPSTDPVREDGDFTELEGSIRCPDRAPFAFDPSVSGLNSLAYEVDRRVLLNRFGGPSGYEFRILSDKGLSSAFALKINCLARR